MQVDERFPDAQSSPSHASHGQSAELTDGHANGQSVAEVEYSAHL